MKRLYSSIILLLIGMLIAKTQVVFGDGCQGVPDGLLFFFLSFIYILILIIFLTISTIKYFRKNLAFNYFPLLTTLLVIIIIYFATQVDKYESSTILCATTSPSNKPMKCSLTLRKNKTFKIKMQEIEWSCFYKGDYKINNDTLILLRQDIQAITDSLISNRYLIDKNKKILIPLNIFNSTDTTRYLTITDDIE